MGSSSLWTGREDRQSIAIDVARRWAPAEPVVERRKSDQPRETFFHAIEEHTFPVPYVWSLDAFVGYLYSLSGVSKRVLGNRAEKMEADLRRPPTSLNSREPNT
jgi:hypothetical protein